MAYKTILTVLSDTRHMAQLDAAASLAAAEDGHLDVLCLGVDHSQSGYYFPGGSPYVFQEAMDAALEDTSTLEKSVRDHLSSQSDLRWSVESAVAQLGGITNFVGMRARFSDLVVLSRPYGPDTSGDAEVVVEAAMFEGGCPVLIVPEGAPVTGFKRVLIAWNHSLESLTATRRALVLLQAAEAVEITIIDPGRRSADGADPGADLAQLLSRHGVNAEITVIARTEGTVSDEINRHAIEIGADLVVMGAYGHSRFRQAILGGATRSMLEKAKVPVFMAR
ncbi:universal stress protein [Paracoccus caeni]|uniref:Universal stress protein n=1 Tax=Paracoccus caeni TaxID=657651 RepID=A0A934SCN4_9RHOB|nr:universal stress protein [Paracoccus caeni]MBK4216426.1 universal stress protein [Paracoccus caeni]